MVSATSARTGIMCSRPAPGNVARTVIPIITAVRATAVPAGLTRIRQAPGTVVLPGIPTTGTASVIPGLPAPSIHTTLQARIPTARMIPPAIRHPMTTGRSKAGADVY
jgi:hypothetical protein